MKYGHCNKEAPVNAHSCDPDVQRGKCVFLVTVMLPSLFEEENEAIPKENETAEMKENRSTSSGDSDDDTDDLLVS